MSPRNKTLLAVIIAVLLLANLGVVIYSLMRDNERRGGDKHRPPLTDFLQKEIGFSPQQLAAFDSLRERHHDMLKPLFDSLSHSRDSLYRLIGNPAVTDSAVNVLTASIARRQALLDRQLFNNFRQVRALCRPEQLPRFDSLGPTIVKRMIRARRPPAPLKKADSSRLAR